MKLLIIADDQQLAEILKNNLKNRYVIDVANDRPHGLQLLTDHTYDLILLDSGASAIDGLTFCQGLRRSGNQVLILLMSSQNTTMDRVMGLDAGADDYVAKPVPFGELEARIRALLRRRTVSELPILTWGKLRIETSSCNVFYDGTPLGLTTKEYSIVELLLRQKERIFSQRALLDALWPSDNNSRGEETVRTHMKRLRQKLRPVGAADLIETVYGLGYRLNPALKVVAEVPTEVPTEVGSDSNADSIAVAGKQDGSQDGSQDITVTQDNTITQDSTITQFWEKQSGRFLQRIAALNHLSQALQRNLSDQELRSQVKQDCIQLVGAIGGVCFPEALPKVKAFGEWLQTSSLTTPTDIQRLRQQIALLGQLLEEIIRHGGNDRSSRLESRPRAILDNNPEQRILMVDPDREYVTELMAAGHRWGFQIVRTTSPLAARESIARVCPDLLLVDCSSGTLDNISLLQLLRERCPYGPICILADGDALDRVAIEKLGGYGFYRKSIPKNVLLQRLQESLPMRQSQNFITGGKVLVVDDDRVMLVFLKGILEPWGFQVTLCNDPRECLALIERDRPDLLILDLEMPQVHGLVLCEQLRSQPETALLPILVLTAHQNLESIQKVYSAGADDFVSKPVITPELMTRIFNRLERSDLVKQQTERDPLTQLLNRSGSLIRFEVILNRAIEAHQPLCLGLVSVESIVELNRTLGYGESDRILSRVANQLLSLSYRDTVIARWENGEFVVIMSGLTAQAGDRILRQSIMAMKSELANVTFGLGTTCWDGESMPENRSDAIATLYRSAVETLRII
jgi:diguanylate cyclase (GGDEF)-like protein